MAKKKVTRKELLQSPDEFISFSNRAAAFVNAHMREVKIIGVAVAVLAIGYLAVHTYLRFVNKRGQEAYNQAFYLVAESSRSEEIPLDYQEATNLFETVINDYGMSKAAELVPPNIAYLKYLEKKYDEAIDHYLAYLDQTKGDNPYVKLTMMALAACYEAKGDFQKAIVILNELAEDREDSYADKILLNLARLYRLNEQPEKAKETLQEFVDNFKDSPLLRFAEAQLLSSTF